MAERDRLNTMFLKGRISEEYYDKRYAELTEKINQSNVIEIADYSEIHKKFSGDWVEVYQSLYNRHRQAFWKGIIKEVRFDAQTHKIKDFSFLV